MVRRVLLYWRYALAIATVLLAALVELALQTFYGIHSSFILFIIPVLVSATVGIGPAICATVLSVLLSASFLGFQFNEPWNLLDLLMFLGVAASAIALARVVDRLRRKSALAEAEAKDRAKRADELADELTLLIDGTSEYAIYMLDPDGNVTIWNEGAERLKGWTESEVIGKNVALFYPADAVARGQPAADLARASELGHFDEEDWRLRKDGSEFLAHVTITALHDKDGKLRGYGKVVRDISEERAAERRLAANAEHLRSILSTVPDAMVVTDEQGCIISFSTAAEKLFGYQEAEVVGASFSLLMPPSQRKQHDEYWHRYRNSEEDPNSGTGRVVAGVKRDGTVFPMELVVGEANSEEQRIFTGFIQDLTERQRVEKKLEELREDLVHAARVSAMGTMASTLAHELNQPITAVNNYVEGVRDMLVDADPVIREALEAASSEALRAGDIIRHLGEFVAHGEVARTVEDVPRLVSEAVALGAIGAHEKGVDVRVDLDGAATPVFVDKVQIQQVLINLVRNAIEAMAKSSAREIHIGSRVENPHFVRVTVADTGPGLPPKIAENLFRAFVSTKKEGMGLGLSICRTIIEANGGRIWLEERPGGGAMFHFTLARAIMEISDDG